MRSKWAVGLAAVIAATTIGAPSWALDPEPGAVFVRVVDVGAGLCCVVRIPGAGDQEGDYYLVYDAGNYQDSGATAMTAIRELIPDDEVIDLLVLSHTDSDHNAAVPTICDEYYVARVLRTGMTRIGKTPKTLTRAREAVAGAVEDDGTLDLNLSEVEFPNGATYRFGDAFVTIVCGFGSPPSSWSLDNKSEKHNAGSIVVRLQFHGKSILFCGDAVGRHNGDPDYALIATEKFMLEQSSIITIDSDVLIAGHHGADNASARAFIEAVTPSHVIFSAGHRHDHPRASTVQRFIQYGSITADEIFRTDRGDDEGAEEWPHGRVPGNTDPKGDDDVDILIRPDGTIEVEYRT